MSQLEVVTTADRHDLGEQARAAFRQNWPEFMFHDPVAAQYIERVESLFGEYDIMLLEAGEVVAGCWGVPLRWDGTAAGLERVIAPVRPALKSRYPLTPMERFGTWSRPDGLHIDPWIRTHQRLGAQILAPAPKSMVITGTVAEWEQWAGMAFPESGRYVVPQALDLVDINRDAGTGVYAETNLWMRHR